MSAPRAAQLNDEITAPRERVVAAITAARRSAVRVLARSLAPFYAIAIVLMAAVQVPPRPVALVLLVNFVVSCVLWLIARLGRINDHSLGAIVFTAVVFISLGPLLRSDFGSDQLLMISVIAVVQGALTLSRPWLVANLSWLIGASLLARSIHHPTSVTFPQVSILSGAAVAAIIIHRLRIASISRTENLLYRYDQKEIERAQTEERYRQVVQLSPDAIAIYHDGKVALINDAGLRLVGARDASEVIGRSVLDFVHTDDRAQIRDRIGRVTQRSVAAPMTEERFVRLDGTTVPVDVVAAPCEYKGDVAVQLIVRDITERKRAERALIEAKEQAEAGSRAKSQFLSTMSHEIRTPMNAVIGMAQLLEMTAINAQQKAYLDVIRASGQNLLAIISTILDFSKIEAGKLELDLQAVDVRALLQQVVAGVAGTVSEKGLLVRVDVEPDIPLVVRTDPTRLQQILLNLVGNAVKFTDNGNVTIGVTMSRGTTGRNQLRFSVRDTGIGIPADRLPQLFEPFEQLDATVTRRYGGTGLGLAISRTLSEILGGRMWATSEVGKGSAFEFEIEIEAAPVIRPAAPPSEQLDRTLGARCPLRILVVEDLRLNQVVIEGMLATLGFSPNIVSGGQEALEALRAEHFDLVLMDVIMPDLDGISVTRTILEELPLDRHPRIVALTANATQDDYDDCVRAGMAEYLSKPIAMADLQAVLKRTIDLRRHSASRAAAAHDAASPPP